MRRTLAALSMLLSLVGMLVINSGLAAGRDKVEDALETRYRHSHVEIQDPRTEGRVRELGAVLTLQAEGVPANKFWVVQPQPAAAKSGGRRLHKFDYAQTEITEDGRLIPNHVNRWSHFTLPKGTPLVVLDLRVENDRVRLFTHTLVPVRVTDGEAAYGCTEFVSRFDPGVLQRGDLAAIQGRIEQWLPLSEAKPKAAR